ncbi:ATP-binding cassette domain-containing protein [Paenarthrobacter sp. NPDC057981]|uniref:ATP-binding cassette domain-containing protein n=1 Tax=Paenarthrobacter sp. NPDC057981 TaxID=3346297 RepID=UPI0036DD3831
MENLSKKFGSGRKATLALDQVTLRVNEGEVLGLVGESGSGKSTLVRTLIGLETADAGAISYDGIDLLRPGASDLRRFRREVQVVFQDPYSSLDPRRTVREIVEEPMLAAGLFSRSARDSRVAELLDVVGLDRASLDRYPRDFSGGQRQRIAIIRALVLKPRVLLCDEPVSALDVSVQAQVLNLLKDMQRELGLTLLFVSHDLAVVKYLCSRLVVLHHGKVVESGRVSEVYASPREDYTKALLDAVPIPDPVIERARRANRQRGLRPVLDAKPTDMY